MPFHALLCASTDRPPSSPSLQCDAAAALLLNQQLPNLTLRLAPLFHTFQSHYPQLAPGACTCFAPYHHTCALCSARRDALETMLASLDDAALVPHCSPVGAAAGSPRAEWRAGHQQSPPASRAGAKVAGKSVNGVVKMGSAAEHDETASLLRSRLREVATRQVYHSLFATSADDQLVAAHLRSLSVLRPSHLGVKPSLASKALWQAAAVQVRSPALRLDLPCPSLTFADLR